MKKKPYSPPSVKKAFKIIQAISDSQIGLGVSELSKQLKMSKSTVHGITFVLEELGVLVRDPIDKKYRIGYTLLELSRKSYGKIALRDVARVPMQKLMETIGETVFLGVVNGDHVTILDVVESPNEVKITSPPGTRIPLTAGATGKVFLSHFEEKKAKDMIQKFGLVKYTSKSIVDPKEFLKTLEEVKKQGYAIDDEEYIAGVRAVAAPIKTGSTTLAAIWVVGFTSNINDQKLNRIVIEIQKVVNEISESIRSLS
jgi:DNA-binding IclR family transcriptional regulator